MRRVLLSASESRTDLSNKGDCSLPNPPFGSGQNGVSMSDVIDEFEDETSETVSKDPVRAHLKKVEQENKVLRQQAQELETLKRKMAFAEAGIDVNAPASKYFMKGYDGEVSAEAIRAAAQEANLLQQQQPKEVVDESEKKAWGRLQQASAQAERNDGEVDWVKKFNSTRNQDEVMQLLAQMREQAQNI